MKTTNRKKRRSSFCVDLQSRRGIAAVEFAVVAPLLLALVLGTVDVGQYVNAGQSVSNASHEGARVAVRSTTSSVSEVESAVRSYFTEVYPSLDPDSVISAIQINVKDGNGYVIPGGDLTALPVGAQVSVQVTFQFDSVRWISSASLLSSSSIATTTVMRRE